MTNVIPGSLAEQIIAEKIKDWQEKRKQSQEETALKIHPFLAVSRDFGCGEEHLIPYLEKTLGWKVYGKNLLDKISEEDYLNRKLLEILDEKKIAPMVDWVNYVLCSGALHQKDYLLKVARLMKIIVLHESAIFLGRGANFILKDKPEGLRIKLTAPFEARVENIRQGRQISQEEARELVRQKDNERKEFIETYFEKDVLDPSGFDMVFNTETFTEEALCQTIQFVMKEKGLS